MNHSSRTFMRGISAALALTAALLAHPARTLAKPPAASPPKHTAAMTFAKAGEAWSSVLADRAALRAVIHNGKLAEAHELAFAIRDTVVTLPYKSSSLTPAKQKLLALQVQNVAGIAENIDKYGDANNAPKTKAEFAKLEKALDAIEKLYPTNALPSSGTKPLSAADKALFLTPGGAYTQADIAANGNTSPYLKYASVVPMHDTKVAPGEAVCPISETKPNPQLTWIIGGKTYTFCCPPCIAEFVKRQKPLRPPSRHRMPTSNRETLTAQPWVLQGTHGTATGPPKKDGNTNE